MITLATKTMLPDLIDIWSECFGDSEEYSGFFFQHQKMSEDKFEQVLVCLEEGKPVSMLTILPAKLVLNGQDRTFWYIYAVATKTSYRKHGFVRKMLDYVYEKSLEENAIIGLTPATEELIRFYKKLNFQTVFYDRTWSFPIRESVSSFNLEECSSESYLKIRNQMFERDGFVKWEKSAISYALAENTLVGGKHYIFRQEKESYIILCCVTDRQLNVKETTLPQELLKDVISYIARKLNCKEAVIRLHPELYSIGKEHAFAMVRSNEESLLNEKGYLGLALD